MWTADNRPRYNRDKLRYPSDLTDAEWAHIEPLTLEVPVSVRSGRGMGPVKRISHVEARPHKVLSFCW